MSGYDRFARRHQHNRSAAGGFVFGGIIIAIGVLMLLNNLGIMPAHDIWDYFPLLFFAMGIGRIADSHQRPPALLAGGIMTIGGMLWFLHNIDVLRFNAGLIWPVIIIAAGVMFLLKALDRQEFIATGGIPCSPQAQLNVYAIFGGDKRLITTPDFRTADLYAMFGGIEIDFSGAEILDQASIDAHALFGGIEIKVPSDWTVEVKGLAVFGGFEDNTLRPSPDALRPAPRLIVSGYAMFGGVSVKTV